MNPVRVPQPEVRDRASTTGCGNASAYGVGGVTTVSGTLVASAKS
jgi:hypothetical protein